MQPEERARRSAQAMWATDEASKWIGMSLDDVGSNNGPALNLIANYQTLRPERRFIAAGGVRNINDINVLAAQGVSAALVASALHAGRLSAEELIFLRQKNAPH